jgi:UDP-N-acetylmuramate: L-alanyl-gamma-D-glutamyl-meso-diaminopimelate ligase
MQSALAPSLGGADLAYCYASALGWDAAKAMMPLSTRAATFDDLDAMVEALGHVLQPGDHVLVMSNGGFGGVHARILDALTASRAAAPGH